jgi:acetyltransferase-like isoleucine patch superfamily enzyme
VIIGEYAIVGAGSVVTHNVPPGMIVAGNPAKPLRKPQNDTFVVVNTTSLLFEGLIKRGG